MSVGGIEEPRRGDRGGWMTACVEGIGREEVGLVVGSEEGSKMLC